MASQGGPFHLQRVAESAFDVLGCSTQQSRGMASVDGDAGFHIQRRFFMRPWPRNILHRMFPLHLVKNGEGKALMCHRRRLHHKRNIGRRVILPAFTLRALQSTPLERSMAPSSLVQLLPNDLGVHGHRLPQIHGQELQEVVDGVAL